MVEQLWVYDKQVLKLSTTPKKPNVISIKNTLNNIFTKNFGWNTSVHPQEARQIEKTKTKHLDDQVLLTQSLLSNNIFLYHFTEFAYNQDISYVIRKQKTNQKENFYKIIKKKKKNQITRSWVVLLPVTGTGFHLYLLHDHHIYIKTPRHQSRPHPYFITSVVDSPIVVSRALEIMRLWIVSAYKNIH